jgi:hypothetical protein
MRSRVDMDRVARVMGATRQGHVQAAAGAFGAAHLAHEVRARFQTPATGGRATDAAWTERRLVPLAPATLDRLEVLAATLCERAGVEIQPMQLAALLLEAATASVSDNDAEALVRHTAHR